MAEVREVILQLTPPTSIEFARSPRRSCVTQQRDIRNAGPSGTTWHVTPPFKVGSGTSEHFWSEQLRSRQAWKRHLSTILILRFTGKVTLPTAVDGALARYHGLYSGAKMRRPDGLPGCRIWLKHYESYQSLRYSRRGFPAAALAEGSSQANYLSRKRLPQRISSSPR